MLGRNIIRSAKPGSEWSDNELMAYNISFREEEPQVFFGRPLGSVDHLDPAAFQHLGLPIPHSTNPTFHFLERLKTVQKERCLAEVCIDLFAIAMYSMMGYEETGAVCSIQIPTPLSICGVRSAATPDCVLFDSVSGIYLMIQEDKIHGSDTPDSQIVAEAIATFQHNNSVRLDYGGQPLALMNIPCITMVGTSPVFYKVPVTKELSDAVETGAYPDNGTVVSFCAPERSAVGMEDVEYRRVCFQYFDAFRQTAREIWVNFIADMPSNIVR